MIPKIYLRNSVDLCMVRLFFWAHSKSHFFWLYFHLNKVAIAYYMCSISLFLPFRCCLLTQTTPRSRKIFWTKPGVALESDDALLYQFLLFTLFYVPEVTVQFTGRLLKVICVWWFALDIGSDILICWLYQPSTICLTEPGIATKWSM